MTSRMRGTRVWSFEVANSGEHHSPVREMLELLSRLSCRPKELDKDASGTLEFKDENGRKMRGLC